MIERYTVRSFEKMEYHPTEKMELVDESYFATMDECEDWCTRHVDIKNLNFEIHHSIGAKDYRYGIASGMGIITWMMKEYNQHDIPRIPCFWGIFDVPSEIDDLRLTTKF